jgi:Fe-S oxidoreductase
MSKEPFESPNSSVLESVLREISDECTECKICVKQCAFLKKYGTPKHIADNWPLQGSNLRGMPFECSLCSLCTAVCPVDIDPRSMFLKMRCHDVKSGIADFKRQRPLISYEKRGTSKLYSFYGMPQDCDTVLFPGCALSGSRSSRVVELYEYLQQDIPSLGIVLDCCTKPSHDLGRVDYFHAMFSEMCDFLSSSGIKKIITACPSCYVVFRQFADRMLTQSVYEILDSSGLQPPLDFIPEKLTVQDSCVARFDDHIQGAVRNLINSKGIKIEEMKHHGKRTLCCGEGGGAHFVAPELAGQWGMIRRKESGNKQIVTYCAGCASFLGRIGRTTHLLDIYFEPDAALKNRIRVTKTPFTYIKRLFLKHRFRRRHYYLSRERMFKPQEG